MTIKIKQTKEHCDAAVYILMAENINNSEQKHVGISQEKIVGSKQKRNRSQSSFYLPYDRDQGVVC